MTAHEDRRIQRTRQLLRASLLELVKEKGFERLSVQEIADRANVGRTTFYAHFSDKQELLLYGFDELREQLKQRKREARAKLGAQNEWLFGFSREMFEHVNDYRDVFQAMVGERSEKAVQSRIQSLLIELVRDDVSIAKQSSGAKSVQHEPLVRFVAGALFGLLTWWLDEKPRLSPEDIDHSFRQLVGPAMHAAASST